MSAARFPVWVHASLVVVLAGLALSCEARLVGVGSIPPRSTAVVEAAPVDEARLAFQPEAAGVWNELAARLQDLDDPQSVAPDAWVQADDPELVPAVYAPDPDVRVVSRRHVSRSM